MHATMTLRKHAALVDDMANAQGLDLEEEVLRARLDLADIEDAVYRCTSCTQVGACEHWLATLCAPAETPPHYCRNTDLFESLRNG